MGLAREPRHLLRPALLALPPSETAKSDFSHEAVFALWDKANYEDWEMCERTHRGLSNPLWTPGQLSLDEEVVSQIDSWVARECAEAPDTAVQGEDAAEPGKAAE